MSGSMQPGLALNWAMGVPWAAMMIPGRAYTLHEITTLRAVDWAVERFEPALRALEEDPPDGDSSDDDSDLPAS